MKKFSEVLQEVESTHKSIDALFPDDKYYRHEWDAIMLHNINLVLKEELLKNNAAILMFEKDISVFVNIWNSHVGEKLSPETEEKIQGEFKKKSNGTLTFFSTDFYTQLKEITCYLFIPCKKQHLIMLDFIDKPHIEYRLRLKNDRFFSYWDEDFDDPDYSCILSIKEEDIIKPSGYFIEDIPEKMKQITAEAEEFNKRIDDLYRLRDKLQKDSGLKNIGSILQLTNPHLF